MKINISCTYSIAVGPTTALIYQWRRLSLTYIQNVPVCKTRWKHKEEPRTKALLVLQGSRCGKLQLSFSQTLGKIIMISLLILLLSQQYLGVFGCILTQKTILKSWITPDICVQSLWTNNINNVPKIWNIRQQNRTALDLLQLRPDIPYWGIF